MDDCSASQALVAPIPTADLTARVLGSFLAMSSGMAVGMLWTCHAFDGLAARFVGDRAL